ncbi:uncharacterized protein LOC128984710 [Macrosteles quadrilineatus]|uniref:uncharacterized protein LOC128984710 n=1 Tax=Macrosteles quadrilineatus TaxID=74068 RepID=UPI0023E19D17|nr:uncharacterized protein LOC128984710 [Macrosteles quadrilineatus]
MGTSLGPGTKEKCSDVGHVAVSVPISDSLAFTDNRPIQNPLTSNVPRKHDLARDVAPVPKTSNHMDLLTRSRPINLVQYCSELDIEIAGIELMDKSLIVLSIYRSPDGQVLKFFDLLDQCLGYLAGFKKNIILGGDFNITLNANDVMANDFVDLLRSHGLFITSLLPTRGPRCLDTVATDLNIWEYQVWTTEPYVADHQAVLMKVNSSMVSPSLTVPAWLNLYTRHYRLLDEDLIPSFKHALSQVPWDDVLFGKQAESAFEAFFDAYNSVFNTFFPLKVSQKVNPQTKKTPLRPRDKSWFTAELKQIQMFVLAFRDRYMTAETPANREHFFNLYTRAKRLYRIKIDQAKKASNVRLIESSLNPCKAVWNLVNNNRNTGQGPSPASKCSASPDDFNTHLISTVAGIVGTAPVDNNEVVKGIQSPDANLSSWQPLTPESLVTMVGHFKTSHSPDIYGMTTVILKHTVNIVAIPLCQVLNSCLSAGIFPRILRVSRTVPIYKKGDPASVQSYRPISIIPTFAKVFETAIKLQLVSYLERNNLMSNLQHGFRKDRSTVTAVSELVHRIQQAFEDTNTVALTLCDLSKAFDCVSHDILLAKLNKYGVRGAVYDTFVTYLENRQQVVSIAGAKSRALNVPHGVPQGSVVGPVLFLIAINDLELSGNALRFADDTTLISVGNNPGTASERAEVMFRAAKDWFETNKLKLNQDKTQKILCSLNSNLAQNVVKVNLLGFTIDPKLSWKDHVDNVAKRLSKVTHLLRKLTRLVDKAYLVVVYHALFHSHVTYGLQLWGHAANVSRILKQQKKALRIMTGSGRQEHCKPIFADLGILTIHSNYILQCVSYVHSNVNTFTTRQQVHAHNTRRKNLIDVPYCRLSRTKDAFPVMALRLTNKLPVAVRDLNHNQFQARLKCWLKARPYYSLKEFFEDDLTGL